MNWKKKEIVCTWSGGIDSTALIANLLNTGWKVFAVTLEFYGSKMVQREAMARRTLVPILEGLGELIINEADGNFLWNFSPDEKEIPRRNRLIIDHLIEHYLTPMDIYYLGMGEYIGADSWVVQSHVPLADADSRALTAYIFQEYGLKYRLFTLADFGESRFKVDRVKLGYDIISYHMMKTTNCLNDSLIHCGECYKCVERRVAFDLLVGKGKDLTEYLKDPGQSPKYDDYVKQMSR